LAPTADDTAGYDGAGHASDDRSRLAGRASPSRRRAAHVALLTLLAAGCAWSNPANRPVWNVFEANVVPAGDAAFYATLPLTVPIGLGAILLDTVVVHPAMVLDDAAGDAADQWDDLDWQQHYYTELGLLPLRAAWTPCVFAASFLGRACFDVPPRGAETGAGDGASAAPTPRAIYLEFFAAIARGASASLARGLQRPQWDDELARAFAEALGQGNAAGRAQLFRTGRAAEMPPMTATPWLGLQDRDPVVRYFELQAWPPDAELPDAVRGALLADPCESVRLLAVQRLR